ncbi:magnesium transporter [Pseudochelatococcus contaminans]|uniref:Magnesium transporter MgtE n=1 Tax=Pseudochelatococcus contaminans TaxID=1538103 RepID=A0A7W5Z2Z8_9HYPH|nr:magnesium transporter [Pseudochelatococcus contaminans]MBB3809168.1 magnesium transporter [Pseudochelatococcus contaminans]
MQIEELRRASQGEAEPLEHLNTLLRDGPETELAAVADLLPAEVARLILLLRPKRARALLRLVPDAPGLAALEELDPSIRERLLDAEGEKRIARIVAKMPVADAADFLADSPDHIVEAALAIHPAAAEIQAALTAYIDESAGAVMRRRLVAVPQDWTIGQVIDEIRNNADLIDRLYAVYVTNGGRRLVGYLKIRDLVLYPTDTVVGSVMRSDIVTVSADTDREEAAHIAERQHLPVLPVVDADGQLVGIITPTELREINFEEAQEDIKKMAGLSVAASAMDGPLQIVPRRLPWLTAGLIGSSIAALVVGAYEDALTEAAILASLIPIVMSLAGNAGIQASTITVQALASHALWVGDISGRVVRELAGALLNGTIVGLIIGCGIMLMSNFAPIENPLLLAATALLTLVVVTVQASVVGSLVPLALKRLRLDPAVATGVFITTSNDVVGVLIFFVIATSIYL